ncbi:ubiquitin carboxyl-terminal hydrolase 15-like isoform X2 [Oncorhynchus nerka]|nr:ubiquitin carboxyl-terminal hydrolase 15-like isoform X2 [Oncorhynchus nerka]XP_029522163.1 ubiquitin carboxyl-terminal hydrolase 15-like isoform X2 [Oncorhynchus nerka]
MRKLFSIPDEKETRLWNKYMSNTFQPLNKPDSTIQDAGLYQGQCLNVPPLTEYFLKDKYNEELNEDNPLGMKGEIAKAYAEITKQSWSGKYSYVTPWWSFTVPGLGSSPFPFQSIPKTQVGCFAPQFSGYQQQDSHELLAFLLDDLHKDLNRIRKKPYILLKDAEGRPDKAWENHIKRNDSIIVDIFHGLFKSTLVCPVCAKVSVTFDPFCYLTLPMKKERTLEVYLVRLDPLAKPTQYKLTVPKVGYISDLCTSLSTPSGVPAEKMIVIDIYNHRFHRIFATNENLSSIMERDDIYVFEVAVNRLEDTDHVVIPVHLREKYKQSGYNHTSTPLFGQPFLITVPRTLSEDKLYNMLLVHLCDMEMSEFLIDPNAGPCRYDLIAVSNHYGDTAYAKNKDDDNFDNSSVSPANKDQIVSKAAYVLFYQRQDTVNGTGYFDLDREEENREGEEERKSVASSQGASASVQSNEDVNDNVTMKTN